MENRAGQLEKIGDKMVEEIEKEENAKETENFGLVLAREEIKRLARKKQLEWRTLWAARVADKLEEDQAKVTAQDGSQDDRDDPDDDQLDRDRYSNQECEEERMTALVEDQSTLEVVKHDDEGPTPGIITGAAKRTRKFNDRVKLLEAQPEVGVGVTIVIGQNTTTEGRLCKLLQMSNSGTMTNRMITGQTADCDSISVTDNNNDKEANLTDNDGDVAGAGKLTRVREKLRLENNPAEANLSPASNTFIGADLGKEDEAPGGGGAKYGSTRRQEQDPSMMEELDIPERSPDIPGRSRSRITMEQGQGKSVKKTTNVDYIRCLFEPGGQGEIDDTGCYRNRRSRDYFVLKEWFLFTLYFNF